MSVLTAERAAHIDNFLHEFRTESDRGAGVLGAAYLDDRLNALFGSKTVGNKHFKKRLLNSTLRNFGARIEVAYATGFISMNAMLDLKRVQDIRNCFAHRLDLTFESSDVKPHCQNFLCVKALTDEDGSPVPAPTTAREKFNVAVTILLLMSIETAIESKKPFEEMRGSKTIQVIRADSV